MGSYDFLEVNEDLVKDIKYVNGLYSEELMEQIAERGSISRLRRIPKDIRDVYVTSMDIRPEVHVKMLAAFQKYTDNAVSKTINLPSSAGVNDVVKIFMLAVSLGCKGITVYRDGSKNEQVLSVGGGKKIQTTSGMDGAVEDDVARGKCPQCGGKLAMEEGCKKCYGCGFSVCG